MITLSSRTVSTGCSVSFSKHYISKTHLLCYSPQATVVEVGPGARSKDGSLIAPSVKKGDRVLLPEYGGSPVKLGDVEYVLYRNDDILGLLENK